MRDVRWMIWRIAKRKLWLWQAEEAREHAIWRSLLHGWRYKGCYLEELNDDVPTYEQADDEFEIPQFENGVMRLVRVDVREDFYGPRVRKWYWLLVPETIDEELSNNKWIWNIHAEK